MYPKEVTYFRSYVEIKVTSKISSTGWDDSFNVSWETMIKFFSKFKIKWNPIDFLSRRKFNN